MPYLWFTDDTSYDWNPTRGYNEAFAEIVRDMRTQYGLVKQRTGFEVGTGRWGVFRPANTSEPVAVQIEWLDWTGHDTFDDYTPTPIFKFKIKVASTDPSTRRQRFWNALLGREEDLDRQVGRVLFEHEVVMVFPSDFPSRPPRFRVDSGRYRELSASHDHHVYQGGWMCIFAYGEWDPRRSTVFTALGVAIDWMVWHFNQFSW